MVMFEDTKFLLFCAQKNLENCEKNSAIPHRLAELSDEFLKETTVAKLKGIIECFAHSHNLTSLCECAREANISPQDCIEVANVLPLLMKLDESLDSRRYEQDLNEARALLAKLSYALQSAQTDEKQSLDALFESVAREAIKRYQKGKSRAKCKRTFRLADAEQTCFSTSLSFYLAQLLTAREALKTLSKSEFHALLKRIERAL